MEDLLKKAILFVQNPINIPPKSIKVIFNFHKSLMYHNKDAWVKKYASVELDVTMGSHDSYGLCGIFELLMLIYYVNYLKNKSIGLERRWWVNFLKL